MCRLMELRRVLRRWVAVVLLGASLPFLSGCALLWLGAGGVGGYMIKKGEEGDGKKKETSRVDQAYAARKDGAISER